MLDKITRTICGIANIGPESSGALFIGVADCESDKTRIETLDRITAKTVGTRYVVGIDRELPLMNLDAEGYTQRIVNHIRDSALSDPLKTSVHATIDCIDYRGCSVISIWVPCQSSVSHVGDVVYIRQGPQTKKVEGLAATQAVMSLF